MNGWLSRLSLLLLLPLLPIPLSAADDQTLGRLFTTPEQRENIDAIRYAVVDETVETEPSVQQEQPVTESTVSQEPIQLRGIIRGESGEPIYWINDGYSLQAGFMQDSMSVLMNEKVKDGVMIQFPDEQIIPLKVGESYVPGADRNKSSLSNEGAEQRRP